MFLLDFLFDDGSADEARRLADATANEGPTLTETAAVQKSGSMRGARQCGWAIPDGRAYSSLIRRLFVAYSSLIRRLFVAYSLLIPG
ncbi:hypothetical protein GXB81_24475 [Paraburkholderia sp. Ac-20336]|uniref:hypothetical protein n=1 Tax=Paraburkholderia sp. Ac-20336 TaxID=2703886 RepID=UPI00197D79C4|nr:hypothetical protein [Paraburkholderia sp. Ac-20336]MBN3806187.1 hypothetical protein [Paraburkholderia sp. Ac-20336]